MSALGVEPVADEPVPRALVRASGVVCWRPAPRRRHSDEIEVLLIHSPRYDAWAWPKGKLEAGETLPECAVRETMEETGLRVVLGRPLPSVGYRLPDGRDKQVDYWAARAVSGTVRTRSLDEVDDVAWLRLDLAREHLTQEADRRPLDALAAVAGDLATRPVILLRHARARPRDGWTRADADRPLVAAGRRQASALADLLACWAPQRILSSPWLRCVQTIAPYATASGLRTQTKGGLSEDGAARSPDKPARHMRRLLAHEESAVMCTHRPVLPLAIAALAAHADEGCELPDHEPWLGEAELLVAHVRAAPAGRGPSRGRPDAPRVVAAERHCPA